jgi:hypothetical protein
MTSPRRIRRWSKTKAAARYLKFYFSYLLLGKNSSSLKEYPPVR